MTLSELSIRRPVLAAVASLLIVVLGLTALGRIPVRELPDVDSAVVSVVTTYRGAAPEVVDNDITEVVEAAVAGISGIKTISSESRRGRSQTVVEFQVGRDIDEAANDVRDAIGRVRGKLPEEIDEPQVLKNDSDADPVMRLAVISDRMSPAAISDYLDRYILDRIQTLDGVAKVEIFGERRYAIRIWLDRRAMAARNMTVADVEAALRQGNLELPAGDIESSQRQLTVRLDSRLGRLEQFRELVIARVAGYPIRLKDIARVELGVEDDSTLVRNNGAEAVGLGVYRQSQANTIAISRAVRQEIARLQGSLPQGMSIEIGSDDARFVAASIREVLIALGISVVLVVLVILLFLLSLRAVIIPAVTIPVSLIGCLLGIFALGFSINVLTLLALLLAIGLVVDDAIIVLENIQRRIDSGESPLEASLKGSRQVTFAVIATSVTLAAVFVPLSFLEGAAGRLFIEFGFVMAAAVAISTFVALSASPALASRVLKPRPATAKGAASPSGFLAAVLRGYGALLDWALKAPLLVIAAAAAAALASAIVFPLLPRELTPSEDRGVLFIPLTAPQGSTVAYTDARTREVEAFATPFRDSGEIATIYSVVGSQGRPYRAFVVLRLAPWESREMNQLDLIRELGPKSRSMAGARGFPVSPAGLGLRGSSTPLRVVISGADFESVKRWAGLMLAESESNERLRNPELDFEENQPQVSLAIDREKLDDLGIGVETVATTLQTFLASREVTDYLDRGREYPVILQAQPSDRATPSDISNIFLRGSSNSLIPLSAVLEPSEGAAAPSLRRYDRLPSITLSAALEESYDLGSAIDYMLETAGRVLPPEAKIGFSGQSQQYLETSSGVTVTFALALLLVFLVLAAQFESFVDPLIIMLSVPLATAGALYSLWLAGLSLNLYSQIGIILLIGLMAKNGILIVEFANQLRDEGRTIREAVVEASVLRLRPIVMTILSTILGAVPLVLASGAGAESRIAIGSVIIGGLAFATVLTLFLTPALYLLLAPLARRERALATWRAVDVLTRRREQPKP